MAILRNKRGEEGSFGVNETLSIIVTVIGLLLLMFGAWKIYDATRDQEAKNAENILGDILRKVDSLDVGQANEFNIRGLQYGPDSSEAWALVGFGKDKVNRPDKCFFESCLCYCKGSSEIFASSSSRRLVRNMELDSDLQGLELLERIVNACQQEGVCSEVDVEKISVNQFITDGINQGFNNGDISGHTIVFMEPISRLYVSVEENSLTLGQGYPEDYWESRRELDDLLDSLQVRDI